MQWHSEKWIRYVIGYVFITSGIVKLIVPEFKHVFINVGFPSPSTTLFLVAIIEITCGALIIARMYLKHATLPLIAIMIGALLFVKIPILLKGDILSFLFESRLDFVMLVLLILVWRQQSVSV